MNRLRIAILRRECIGTVDGVNRFIFTLADGLSNLGHEVFIVAYSKNDRYSPKINVKNFFGLEKKVNIITLNHADSCTPLVKVGLSWLTKGSDLLNTINPDAIITNGIAPLRTNIPKISVNHGIRTFDNRDWETFQNRIYRQIGRYLYKKYSDYRVCVSETLQKDFVRMLGLESSLILLPVKCHHFKTTSNHKSIKNILHVGTRLGKNLEISIKTLQILVNKMNINAVLTVVGSNTNYAIDLANKYSKLLGKRLNFVFDADIQTMANLFENSQALILPSKYEVSPYSVIEAFASGVPAVVSGAVTKSLVIDDFNGYHVNSFQPAHYALKLAKVFNDEENWNTLSTNAFQTAQKFSYLKIAKQYETIITELAKAPSANPGIVNF